MHVCVCVCACAVNTRAERERKRERWERLNCMDTPIWMGDSIHGLGLVDRTLNAIDRVHRYLGMCIHASCRVGASLKSVASLCVSLPRECVVGTAHSVCVCVCVFWYGHARTWNVIHCVGGRVHTCIFAHTNTGWRASSSVSRALSASV